MPPRMSREYAFKHYTSEIKKANGYREAAVIFARCRNQPNLTLSDQSILQGLMCAKRDNPFKKPGGEFK